MAALDDLAQALLVACEHLDASASMAAVFQEAGLHYNLAGRAATGIAAALFIVGLAGATVWLACYGKPWRDRSMQSSSTHKRAALGRGTVWAAFVLVAGILYCVDLALMFAYGQFSPALPVGQAVLAVAFLVLWIGVMQIFLQRLGEVPLLERPTKFARPPISAVLEHATAYIAPLPVVIALVVVYQMLSMGIGGVSAVLTGVLTNMLPLPTDIQASGRLGPAQIDSIQNDIARALGDVFQADKLLAYTRMAAALALIPLAVIIEVLACWRLTALISHAHDVESARMGRIHPRMLRLPSLATSAPLRMSPPAKETDGTFPAAPAEKTSAAEAPLVHDGSLKPDQEDAGPRAPAADLLRAPTMRTISSKWSSASGTATALPSLPKFDRVPSTVAGSSNTLPTEVELISMRKGRFFTTLGICGLIGLYAVLELTFALVGGMTRIVPLVIIGLIFAGSEIAALTSSYRAGKRQPEHLIIEAYGRAL